MNSKIIEANRRVHSSLLLSGEYQKSPHRSPESVRRVQAVLSGLHVNDQHPLHLDIGCGDGFIFECAPTMKEKSLMPEGTKVGANRFWLPGS